MNLVNVKLNPDDPGHAPAPTTVRAMAIGQHLMAFALTTIGVIRAISVGIPVSISIITGVSILVWYMAGVFLPSSKRGYLLTIWWLVGLTVIWIVAVSVSSEFVWVAFLLWLMAGHLLPLVWGMLYSVLVLAIVITAPILQHGFTNYGNIFGPLIGGVFAFGISRGYLQLLQYTQERERLVNSLTSAQATMAELQSELAAAQRESGARAERTRISRDIHDTIAQSLSSIKLLAHAGASRSDDPTAARTLEQISTIASESLVDVRRIVAALSPIELENNALASALSRLVQKTEDEAKINCELLISDSIKPLPTEAEVALLRIAQSGLSNIRIHAAATEISVSLTDTSQAVILEIRDNGVGFDTALWSDRAVAPASPSGFGLSFMRARMQELGGDMNVQSSPGAGTTVTASLPFDHTAPRLEIINNTNVEDPR